MRVIGEWDWGGRRVRDIGRGGVSIGEFLRGGLGIWGEPYRVQGENVV